MPSITKDDDGLYRINSNLLPLLRKLGIKGGGEGFTMPPVIFPVIDIETLEEASASAQLQATATGNLTNVGDAVQITVPAGEVWKIEHVFAFSVDANVNRRDVLRFLLGGFDAGIQSFPNAEWTGNANVAWAWHENFDKDFFLSAADVIEIERVGIVTTATAVSLVVAYRLV